MPTINAAEILIILEFGGLHKRENPLYGCYHSCLCSRKPGNLLSKDKDFACRVPMPDYPHLSNGRTTTRERGNDFQGWAIYTDGGTRLGDGETLAGWGAVARSLHGGIDVMFGPGITTEAHLAFGGARTHSDNTAEMSAMIEALCFLGPHGPGVRDANSCILTPNMLLVFAWARFRPARMFSLRSLANSHCRKSNTGYVLPCNMCAVIQGIWEMNVQIMLLALGALGPRVLVEVSRITFGIP